MMEEKEVLWWEDEEELQNMEEGEEKQASLLVRLKNYLESFQGKQDNR
jgi:hypothetical protein